MFYRYEIKNNGQEDILYLYLDIKSEYSKELAINNTQDEITRRAKNFIINNEIKFNGNKVFLIIDGMVVKTLDLNKSKVTPKSSRTFSNDDYTVNIKLEDGSFIEVVLKKYLQGILASIYNSSIEDETLKCITILYRTYAYKMMIENKYLENSSKFFQYKEITSYKSIWLNDYNLIVSRFNKAIDETDCMFLNYNNNYILPFIHINNNGLTYENNIYPYLSSVSSLWDLSSVSSKEILDFTYEEISNILGIKVTSLSKFKVTDIDSNGSIINLLINNKNFAGEEFRQLLALKSLNFNIILYNNFFRIITFGFGNFLGLSLFGANELAKDGVNFQNILNYYFPKVKLNKYIKELP